MPLIWIVVAIISAVSAGGAVQQLENMVSMTPTPTPNVMQELQKEMAWITPVEPIEENTKPIPTVPVKANIYIQAIPTWEPLPTLDSDPIITCNSKTGKIQVKRSVCSSYTDCPDGSGGYIFESQQACKDRWQKIGGDLKKTTKDYVDAIQERSRLQSEQLRLDRERSAQEAQQKMQEQFNQINQDTAEAERKFQEALEKNRKELEENFKNAIKTPIPIPTKIWNDPSGCVGVGCLY